MKRPALPHMAHPQASAKTGPLQQNWGPSPPIPDSQMNPGPRFHDASRAQCPSPQNFPLCPAQQAVPLAHPATCPWRKPRPEWRQHGQCCSRPRQGGQQVLLFTPSPGTTQGAGLGRANFHGPSETKRAASRPESTRLGRAQSTSEGSRAPRSQGAKVPEGQLPGYGPSSHEAG